MMIDQVTGGRWWRNFRFEALTHPCAYKRGDRKDLSLTATCRSLAASSGWLGVAGVRRTKLSILVSYWLGAEA